MSKRGKREVWAYLSGAMEHAPDGGKGWRSELRPFLRRTLGHCVFDPTHRLYDVLTPSEKRHFRHWKTSDTPRFVRLVRKMIRRDAYYVTRKASYVICYWDSHAARGAGTHAEVTLAHIHHKPVYLVLGMPLEEVSGWILGCATRLFPSFSELKSFLKEHYKKPASNS
jgi:hypothetical protein